MPPRSSPRKELRPPGPKVWGKEGGIWFGFAKLSKGKREFLHDFSWRSSGPTTLCQHGLMVEKKESWRRSLTYHSLKTYAYLNEQISKNNENHNSPDSMQNCCESFQQLMPITTVPAFCHLGRSWTIEALVVPECWQVMTCWLEDSFFQLNRFLVPNITVTNWDNVEPQKHLSRKPQGKHN